MTLYGVRARSTPEESNEREMRREVRLVFPEVFNSGTQCIAPFWPFFLLTVNTQQGNDNGLPPLPSTCITLLSAPRYQQVRTVKQWFLPLLLKQLTRCDAFLSFLFFVFIDYHLSLLDNPLTHVFVRTYCVAIDLVAQVKCYRAVLEVRRV